MKKTRTCLIAVPAALVLLMLLAVTAKALINPNFTPQMLVEQSSTILVVRLSKPDEKKQIKLTVVRALKGKVPEGELTVDLSASSQKAWAEHVGKLAAARGSDPVPFFIGKYKEEGQDGEMGMGAEGEGEEEDTVEVALLQIDRDWVRLDRGKGNVWNMSGVDSHLQGTWDGGSDMLIKAADYIKDNPDDAQVPVAEGCDWLGSRKIGEVPARAAVQLLDLGGEGRRTLFVAASVGDRLYRWDAGKKALAEITAAKKLASKSQHSAWADLNGDGRLDIASWDGAELSLYLQGADGSFGQKVEVPVEVEGGCLGLAAVDIGVKGRAGLVVSTARTPVLIRSEGKAFKARRLPAGAEAAAALGAVSHCLVADFDGDGLSDVLQPCEKAGLLYKGEGGGAFAAPSKAGVPAGKARPDARVVDLDGKGTFSLYVADPVGDRLYSWDAGKKTLAEVTAAKKLDSKSQHSVWADLDGDGRLDIACWDGTELGLYLQSAEGSFGGKVKVPVRVEGGCLGLAAVDIGVKGRPGLVVSTAGEPVLLRPEGKGYKPEKLPVGPEPNAALGKASPSLAADFDGDGFADVLQLFEKGGLLYKGKGGGAFAAAGKAAASTGEVRFSARAVNLGAKGAFTLYLSASSGDRLYRWDAGKKAFADVTAVKRLAAKSLSAVWADLDGDARLDLASWDGKALSLYLQGPDGSFGKKVNVPVKAEGGCLGLAALDAGVKGRPGLLVSTAKAPVLLRPEGGAFKAEELPAYLPGVAALGEASHCLAADLDGDGLFDVLQPFERGGLVYKGKGGGAFAAPAKVDLGSGKGRASTCLGDYDMDGLLDVYLVGTAACQLWSNKGKLKFVDAFGHSGEMCYTAQAGGLAAQTCDINNDGLQDLLIVYGQEEPTHLYFNRGFRSFGKSLSLIWENQDVLAEVGRGQRAATIADLNGDGAQDMAVVRGDGAVLVYPREVFEDEDEQPLSVRAVLPVGADYAGPMTVTAWSERRCLGAWSVTAGSTGAFFGQASPGEVTVKWVLPGGEEQKKVVELEKKRQVITLGAGGSAAAPPPEATKPEKPASGGSAPAAPAAAQSAGSLKLVGIAVGAVVVVLILVLVLRKSKGS